MTMKEGIVTGILQTNYRSNRIIKTDAKYFINLLFVYDIKNKTSISYVS